MRLDFRLDQVKSGYFKQKLTLEDFRNTRRKLVSRNQKLLASAATNKSQTRPISLLSTASSVIDRRQVDSNKGDVPNPKFAREKSETTMAEKKKPESTKQDRAQGTTFGPEGKIG